MPNQHFAGAVMHFTRGTTHLLVGVGPEVFHEEINRTSLSLQHAEEL